MGFEVCLLAPGLGVWGFGVCWLRFRLRSSWSGGLAAVLGVGAAGQAGLLARDQAIEGFSAQKRPRTQT